MRLYFSGCNSKTKSPDVVVGKHLDLMPSYWYLAKDGEPTERMRELFKRRKERDNVSVEQTER